MRIISGSARGRKLLTLEGLDTRPTLDRVREALFGMLQFQIPGASVLDLFAGSGALGLEALSRGAKKAVFNDRSAGSTAVIAQNIKALGYEKCSEVLRLDYSDAIRRLAARGERFDMLFIDAPYATGDGIASAKLAIESGIIAPGGIISLEHSTGQSYALEGYSADARRYGKASITLFRPLNEKTEKTQKEETL